jgi:glucokinase
MILAGDIGGTKSLLALCAQAEGPPQVLHAERFENAGEPGFETIAARFVAAARSALGSVSVTRACFALAGPVEGRRVKLTNLPWEVDADALERALGIDEVLLVNDFVAAAAGLDALASGDLHTLQAGTPVPNAPRVAIGAGTGLGVAYLIWHDGRYRVVGGEGGHMGFAPTDDEQARLWRFLHEGTRRVIAEDVVSGPGLARIHAFVCREAGRSVPEVSSAEVSAAALDGDPLAGRALDLFAACFGAVAGDHALAVLARGGVYIAGGVAPKILPRLAAGGFIAAFNEKGAHRRLVEQMPVHVVTEERLGLLGAAMLALRP